MLPPFNRAAGDRRSRRRPGFPPVFAALFLACTFGCAPGGDDGAVDDPFVLGPHPIIVVDVDTLRADHLGCYGYPRPTSPHVDAFADEAIRFEWAFSQAPNTPPSQTSILTGLYPSTHGMILDEDRVPEGVTTLAEALGARGFRTAAFVDGGYMAATWGIGQGFETYDVTPGKGLAEIGPKVRRWLRENAAETFLLLIHTYDVHTPYSPPEPYRSMFTEGLEPPTPGFEPDAKQMEEIRLSVWGDEPRSLPPADLAYAKARYDGGIRYVDDWFGELLEQLEELELLERATVVFISDHGDEFQEHGSVLHEKLYSTVTRIPLIIRLPGGAVTRTVPEIVEAIDLMPTLLELTGTPVPPEVQGRSLLPLLRGEPDREPVAVGESPYFGVRRFLAKGDHRLLWTTTTDAVELYRFRSDPLEQEDLSTAEPEKAAELHAALQRWQAMIDSTPSYDAESDEMSAETREQLEALGYIQ